MRNEDLETRFKQLLLPPATGSFEDGGQGPEISTETVIRTKRCIDQMKQLLSEERDILLGDPYRVMRDLEGGIDVEWRGSGEYFATMNVSAEVKQPAIYYWERCDRSDRLEGELI